MFVRFRQTARRLQASLIATRREGGKVRHEHVAGLGSVPLLPSPADRFAFWAKLHQRLATLANRLDSAAHVAILAAVHTRIPMPTAEDQEAARNGGRKANAGLFAALRDKHRDLADAYRKGAEQEAGAAEAVDAVEDAYASRAMTRAEMRRFLKSIGMTAADLRHCGDLASLCQRLGEDNILPMLSKESVDAGERAARRGVRSLVRSAG
jgi:hypothetical protein